MSAGDYYREWREARDRLAQEASESEPASEDADMWERVERIERSLAALDTFLDGIEEALTGRPAVRVRVEIPASSGGLDGEDVARALRYLGPG